MALFNAIDYLDNAMTELRIVRKSLSKNDGNLDQDMVERVIEARSELAAMIMRHVQVTSLLPEGGDQGDSGEAANDAE
jgi:hypothetical protein